MDYNQVINVVKSNDFNEFQRILEDESFDINYRYGGDKNLLHVLIDNNVDTSYIKAALEKGVDIESQWVMEETPLQNAIYSKSSNSNETVKILLQHGANTDIVKDGKSLLYYAIENGNGIKGQYLLSHGASTNPISNDKPLALLFLSNAIADERYYQALDHLIKTKDLDINHKNEKGNSILDSVIKGYTKNDLYYLLKKDNIEVDNINQNGQNALIAFVQNRTKAEKFTHNEAKEYNIEIVDYMIDKKKIDIHAYDNDGKNIFDYIPSQHVYLREHIEQKIADQEDLVQAQQDNNLHDLIRRRKPKFI